MTKTAKKKIKELKPRALYRPCDPKALAFKTTNDLEPFDGILGQERAVDAIEFGSSAPTDGFNLFLFGPPGTGKFDIIQSYLKDKAKVAQAPPDWIYVNNFSDNHKPVALSLPAGRGPALKNAIHQLIDDIRASVTSVFESEDYRNRRQVLEDNFRENQQLAFDTLSKKAKAKDVALIMTQNGFALAPTRGGKVINPEVFNALGKTERALWQTNIKALEQELEAVIAAIPRRAKELRTNLRNMNREVTAFAVDSHVGELRAQFSDVPDVLAHIDAMRTDLIDNIRHVLGLEDDDGHAGGEQPINGAGGSAQGLGRYDVNVMVCNDPENGAPIIHEDHPTLGNLIGRIEHIEHMGALLTDFRMIKPGALHQALGGYIILDARQVLIQPFAWEALKRALKSGCIKTESPGKFLSIISTVSLEPEPIELDLKVVLIGERMLYYLLDAYDPEFSELFKVGADFDDRTDRTPQSESQFARLIATLAQKETLRPFQRDAVARIIEHSARLSGDSERLSLELAKIRDLMREADWIADKENAKVVKRTHFQKALDAVIRRKDRIRERSNEAIERGDILIDSEGEVVGQINALSVLQIGGYAFGRPTRITARTWMGKGRVIDIEREVEMGGPTHSKGVLILSSFLSSHFVPGMPLALSASLVFEQSYGGVDGDSASSTELYALLSSLSGMPLKQSLAVTGSVNQHGQVQAIGGVNEKIEGFFDICKGRGLNGEQGVLIPSANVKHLMLRDDVVAAVRDGSFHIYPVQSIAEGIEILTGMPAGLRDANGAFPDNTLYHAVEQRLSGFAEAIRDFQKSDGTENDKEVDKT